MAEPFGNGHINSTFLVTVEGAEERYILQRINSYVFTRPKEVMENILRVTEYLQDRIREEGGDPDRETIRLVRSVSGEPWVQDEEGEILNHTFSITVTENDKHLWFAVAVMGYRRNSHFYCIIHGFSLRYSLNKKMFSSIVGLSFE